jgi:hypothetical protein
LVHLLQSGEGTRHGALEAARVGLGLRADGGDDEDIPDAPVERAPRAAARTGPAAPADATLMREGELRTEGSELVDGAVEGHSLCCRHFEPLTRSVLQIPYIPHHCPDYTIDGID